MKKRLPRKAKKSIQKINRWIEAYWQLMFEEYRRGPRLILPRTDHEFEVKP